MKSKWLIVTCTVGWIFVSSPLFAQSSIETKAIESLKKLFGDSANVSMATLKLTSDEQKKISEQSKMQWRSDNINIYICNHHNKTVGVGFVDNVKGKTQFITYLVAVDTAGGVKDVDVLAYRESYGGEIAYESFRKQFHQKTVNDPLRPGNDIKNISGATISVRAITFGVKKMLAVFDVIKPRLVQ